MVPVPLGPDQPFTGAGFGGTAVLQEAGTAALLSAFGSTSVAPSALFGIPEPPVGTGTTPGSIIDLVRALAGETTRPRRGPALPTQARHETVLARGVQPAGDTRYGWGAVLSGARWQEESRCSAPELGGRGYGTQVVRAALDEAVAEGRRIVPSCPFVRAVVQQHPDAYGSLVA